MRGVVDLLALLGLAPASLDEGSEGATPVPSIPFEDARSPAVAGRDWSAWYAYTPAEDETVHVSVTGDGADPTLEVWVQDERGRSLVQRAAGPVDGAPALVRVRLTAGRTYVVRAGACAGEWPGDSGGRLVVRVEPAPAGLSSVDTTVTGVTVSWNGAVTVAGTVRSDRSGWADVYPQVTQAVGPFVAHADGHVGTQCGPESTEWRASLQSSTWIGFGAGRMTVSAVVWAYDRYGSASAEVAPAVHRARSTR